ncbi:MAG: hypothetical protein ILA39_03865 [Bacteroidaceae bacterium]|nr:hypothetical protein [Bacteroidaceae bacterium]
MSSESIFDRNGNLLDLNIDARVLDTTDKAVKTNEIATLIELGMGQEKTGKSLSAMSVEDALA